MTEKIYYDNKLISMMLLAMLLLTNIVYSLIDTISIWGMALFLNVSVKEINIF